MSAETDWPRRPIRANPLLLFSIEPRRGQIVQAEQDEHRPKRSAVRRFFMRFFGCTCVHHQRIPFSEDSMSPTSSPRVQLPMEIVNDIFGCLGGADLESCTHVSTSWKVHITAESYNLPVQRFGSVTITFCVSVLGPIRGRALCYGARLYSTV